MSNEELYPSLDTLGLGATVRGFVPGNILFGRFVLRRVLGWGHLGVVWLAFDEHLQSEVALKFLPEIVRLDAVSVDELLWETSRYGELNHPNIVRLYDLVGDASAAAISAEYIDGHPLSKWRTYQPSGAFEVEQIQAWIAQLLDALVYAHAKEDLFHRDLKPSNLLINEAGALKITDFGTARSISNSVSRLDLEANRVGTVVYTSQQQLMGGDPSPQDDIYSFGATVYDLLTSKPPFLIENGDLLKQVWKVVPPSMTERRRVLEVEGAVIPLIWEQTIASCLAKDPAQRPQTITEVAERLGLGAAPIPPPVTEPIPSIPVVEVVPAEPSPLPSPVVEVPPIRVPSSHAAAPVATKASPAPAIETPPVKTLPPRTVEVPATKAMPVRFSLKDQLIVFSLILLFALDVLGYFFIFVMPRSDKERQAEMIQLADSAKAAAADAEKMKTEEAAALAQNAEDKATLQKARADAEARAAAAEQTARQAQADADKAKQTTKATLQRVAAVIGPVAGQPWTNGLGVKFVPAGTDGVLFSVWDIRVKDYAAFVAATGHEWPKPKFAQTENEPAVQVSWDDAHAFCDWLTKKEQGEGRLAVNQQYRLPSDAEWSRAVGLTENGNGLPKENDGDVKDVYPWGSQWPPPAGAGNYAESLTGDGFSKTSPVGSFAANAFGLYDMGGNVWQWCEDRYDYAHDWRVLRGASWVDRMPDSLLSSSRSGDATGARDDGSGFRVVVQVGP